MDLILDWIWSVDAYENSTFPVTARSDQLRLNSREIKNGGKKLRLNSLISDFGALHTDIQTEFTVYESPNPDSM